MNLSKKIIDMFQPVMESKGDLKIDFTLVMSEVVSRSKEAPFSLIIKRKVNLNDFKRKFIDDLKFDDDFNEVEAEESFWNEVLGYEKNFPKQFAQIAASMSRRDASLVLPKMEFHDIYFIFNGNEHKVEKNLDLSQYISSSEMTIYGEVSQVNDPIYRIQR